MLISRRKIVRPTAAQVEKVRDQAEAAYDHYVELRQKLYDMDELEGDRLTEWVDNHAG